MKVTSEDLKSLYQESTARSMDSRADCLTAETMMKAAAGRLGEEERARVAEHLAGCSDCVWEFRFVRAHKPWAEEAGRTFALKKAPTHSNPAATRSSPWRRIGAIFSPGLTPLAISAPLLLLALLALGSWSILARKESNRQIAQLNQRLETADRSLAEARGQLEEEIRSHDQVLPTNPSKQYDDEIARLRRELTTPQLGTPFFELDTIRGGLAESPLSIEIPKTANSVMLILNFNDRQQHSVYEVEISDQNNNQIWLGKSRNNGNKLNLTLPRRFLTGERYLIKLYGLENDKKVRVADYSLTISIK
ncbi:MAG: zf-HC2 domain-containing protein [Blastocatellia bacterium]|nr:zf-HC2 domain-containing protein [Blastocatellia bacterium]